MNRNHRSGLVRWLMVVSLCLLEAGCAGYSLVGLGSNLPEDVKRLYVEPLVNSTQRAQVEQLLTQAIAEELVTRRRFQVVNNAREADAILRGTVLSFLVRPLSFDGTGLADNFEINITSDMRFERVPRGGDAEGEMLWSNSRYVFRQDYPLEEGGLDYFDRELIAIEEASERFAETLVADLLEGF